MEVITIGIVPQSWKIRYSHTGLLVRDISYNCQLSPKLKGENIHLESRMSLNFLPFETIGLMV